jgi:pimeloyl-ACP methyl ester carboxylesterase
MMILHGAFGTGHNWATIARRLIQQRPDWGLVLPDLRLHGQSLAFPPPHTLEAAAADILALTQTLSRPVGAVLGHSLGGKVALRYAASHPAGLRQVWVVEISPASGSPAGSAWQMLRAVQALPSQFASRADAAAGLIQAGFTSPVAQWMTTNLEQVDGRYRWRLDFRALDALLRDAFARDLWSIINDLPDGVVVHFIKATDSDALREDTTTRLRALNGVAVHILRGGHWIQADNPDGVVDLLSRHLPAGESAIMPP